MGAIIGQGQFPVTEQVDLADQEEDNREHSECNGEGRHNEVDLQR